MTRDEILRLDRAHVWHPYASADADEDPIVVARAKGACLWDTEGKRYYDGNSSWWVASLGHGHPRLSRVLREQAEVLDHCALGGITHENAARLAAELVEIAPRGLNRVFYTDNGSGAVEVAIKIATQTWQSRGAKKKQRFVALDGAFHGDTMGATSLGGVEVFTLPFQGLMFDCVRTPFPDPNAYDRSFDAIASILAKDHDSIAAVVVEPIVQGAAGMRIYDPRYLRELRELTRKHDVLLVVDEVFTGYGRTGPMWASDHARITPDIMCIGKAFSAMIPMAATLVTDEIMSAFRGEGRALYYGHTFCGNPIGAALALEVLSIYRDEKVLEQVQRKAELIERSFARIATKPNVERVRSIGMIGAADLNGGSGGYLGKQGWRVYQEAKRRGAYLRPLGDTVYVCPPLTMPDDELEDLLAILDASIS